MQRVKTVKQLALWSSLGKQVAIDKYVQRMEIVKQSESWSSLANWSYYLVSKPGANEL